jgi:hypothetical protein
MEYPITMTTGVPEGTPDEVTRLSLHQNDPAAGH